MKLASAAVGAFLIAVAPGSGQAQLGTTAKPAAGQAVTSTVSVPPSVTFEELSIGRRMIVNLSAPRSEATLGRPADVREVVLKSDTWYCEPGRDGQPEVTGSFANQVRGALEGYLAGEIRPSPQWRILANGSDLDAFAANLLNGGARARLKVNGRAQYGGPVSGEIRFNDCYTAQDMQAIKTEVARILGPSN